MYHQVGITVKNKSDIDNKSDPNLALLHMLSECYNELKI